MTAIENAITVLKRGMDVVRRNHRRTDTAIWEDFGGLEMTIKIALDDLEPGADHSLPELQQASRHAQCERCGETDGHRPGCTDEDGPLT